MGICQPPRRDLPREGEIDLPVFFFGEPAVREEDYFISPSFFDELLLFI
jgi:hypothetical protein